MNIESLVRKHKHLHSNVHYNHIDAKPKDLKYLYFTMPIDLVYPDTLCFNMGSASMCPSLHICKDCKEVNRESRFNSLRHKRELGAVYWHENNVDTIIEDINKAVAVAYEYGYTIKRLKLNEVNDFHCIADIEKWAYIAQYIDLHIYTVTARLDLIKMYTKKLPNNFTITLLNCEYGKYNTLYTNKVVKTSYLCMDNCMNCGYCLYKPTNIVICTKC